MKTRWIVLAALTLPASMALATARAGAGDAPDAAAPAAPLPMGSAPRAAPPIDSAPHAADPSQWQGETPGGGADGEGPRGSSDPSFAQVPPPGVLDAGAEASADGGAETDADGGADAGADGGHEPPVYPSFAKEPFSEEHTPKPKDAEWAGAERVVLDRQKSSAFLDQCETRRIREWIRIRCKVDTGAISLMGGERDGLALHMDPIRDEFAAFPDGADIVLPVRRGDRRVIEWLTVEFGYKGANSLEPFFIVSESWLPGDERPTIIAQ